MKTISTSIDFESIVNSLKLDNRNILLFIIGVLTLGFLGAIVAIMMMMPLKKTEVELVTIDGATGQVVAKTALAEFTTGDVLEMTSKDALNISLASAYIVTRDSYSPHTLTRANQIIQVQSTPEIYQQWVVKFTDPSYGFDKKMVGKFIETKVITINEEPTGDLGTPFLGTSNGVTMRARIEKNIFTYTKKGNKKLLQVIKGDIRMTFGYDLEAELDRKARQLNPLAFIVTSYSFTPEEKQ